MVISVVKPESDFIDCNGGKCVENGGLRLFLVNVSCKTNIKSIWQSGKALSMTGSQGNGVGFFGAGFAWRLKK